MENKHYPYFATYSSKLLTHFMFYSFSSSWVQVGTLPSSSSECVYFGNSTTFTAPSLSPGSLRLLFWMWNTRKLDVIRAVSFQLAAGFFSRAGRNLAPPAIHGTSPHTALFALWDYPTTQAHAENIKRSGSPVLHFNYRGSNLHRLRTNSVLIGTKNREIKERHLICFGNSFYFGRTLSGWMRKDPHRYFSNMMEKYIWRNVFMKELF